MLVVMYLTFVIGIKFNELSWVLKDLDEAKRYLANNKD